MKKQIVAYTCDRCGRSMGDIEKNPMAWVMRLAMPGVRAEINGGEGEVHLCGSCSEEVVLFATGNEGSVRAKCGCKYTLIHYQTCPQSPCCAGVTHSSVDRSSASR